MEPDSKIPKFDPSFASPKNNNPQNYGHHGSTILEHPRFNLNVVDHELQVPYKDLFPFDEKDQENASINVNVVDDFAGELENSSEKFTHNKVDGCSDNHESIIDKCYKESTIAEPSNFCVKNPDYEKEDPKSMPYRLNPPNDLRAKQELMRKIFRNVLSLQPQG